MCFGCCSRVQNLFHSVQLNVNNPHFLIMQGRITKVRGDGYRVMSCSVLRKEDEVVHCWLRTAGRCNWGNLNPSTIRECWPAAAAGAAAGMYIEEQARANATIDSSTSA